MDELKDDPDSPREGLSRRRSLRRKAALALVIGCLPVVNSALYSSAYPVVSPIDEYNHIDYLYRASDWELPRQGDVIGQETMRELACRGVDGDFDPPPCVPGGTYAPASFGHLQESNEAQQPPLYYFVTAALARVLVWATPFDNLVDAARVVGGIWLGAGLALFWFAAIRWGAPRPGVVATSLLVATTPAVLHATSTVNNDAAALVAGGVLLAAMTRWKDGAGSVWWLPLSAGVAVALKPTAIIAVGAVGVFLALTLLPQARASMRRTIRERAIAAGAVLGGGALSLLAWTLVQRALSHAATTGLIETQFAESLSADQLLATTFDLISPVKDGFIPLSFGAAFGFLALAGATLNVLLIAATYGGVLYRRGVEPLRLLAVSAAVALPIGALLLTLGNFYYLHIYTRLPARYSLAVVPLMAVLLASTTGSKLARRFLGGLAAVCVGLVLLTLVALQ